MSKFITAKLKLGQINNDAIPYGIEKSLVGKAVFIDNEGQGEAIYYGNVFEIVKETSTTVLDKEKQILEELINDCKDYEYVQIIN